MEYKKELIILSIGIIKEGFCEKMRLLQIYVIKHEVILSYCAKFITIWESVIVVSTPMMALFFSH